jgi:hypothetical protein
VSSNVRSDVNVSSTLQLTEQTKENVPAWKRELPLPLCEKGPKTLQKLVIGRISDPIFFAATIFPLALTTSEETASTAAVHLEKCDPRYKTNGTCDIITAADGKDRYFIPMDTMRTSGSRKPDICSNCRCFPRCDWSKSAVTNCRKFRA